MSAMSCGDFRELAFDARRGALDETATALFNEHVTTCDECGAYAARLDGLLTRRAADSWTPARHEALWERIATSLPAPRREVRLGRSALVATLSAAAVLTAVLVPTLESAPPPTSVVGTGLASPPRPETPDLVAARPERPHDVADATVRPATPPAYPSPPRVSLAPLVPPRIARPTSARRAPLPSLAELLGAGEVGAAAARVEAQLATGAPDAAPLHLELARLYAHRLGDPMRAVRHLRLFLASAPSDAAAPSAFRELCRLTARAGSPEPMCPLAIAHDK